MNVLELWAKMPCNWQTLPEKHLEIRFTPIGNAIAALKLYIALCLKANFTARSTLPTIGCIKRSLTQLGSLVGLSKPMVIRGLSTLEKWELIENLGGRPTIYKISEYDTAKYWTKLPRVHLCNSKNEKTVELLHSVPNRGKTSLHALQLYLYIAAIRDRNSQLATVTYDRLSEVLAISRNDIAKAISTLVSNDMLSVRLDDEITRRYPSNIYWLRGMAHAPVSAVEKSRRIKLADDFAEYAPMPVSDSDLIF